MGNAETPKRPMENAETPKRRNADMGIVDCSAEGGSIVDSAIIRSESSATLMPFVASWPPRFVASRSSFLVSAFRHFGVLAFPIGRFGVSLFVLCLPLIGCAAKNRTFRPPVAPATMDDAVFLHYLATVPVVTVDEGMRAVLLIKGSTVPWPTFETRRDELIRVGALRKEWPLAPDQVLDKGTLAHMLRVICCLPRSASELVVMPMGIGVRRYALKTCIFEGVMPYATEYQPVTGGEMLSIIAKAEERYSAEGSAG